MKTQILKLGMPLVAFLLAIVFAFANEPKPEIADNAIITGYVQTSTDCLPVPKNCAPAGLIVCTFNGLTIHAEKNGTRCRNALYEWMP